VAIYIYIHYFIYTDQNYSWKKLNHIVWLVLHCKKAFTQNNFNHSSWGRSSVLETWRQTSSNYCVFQFRSQWTKCNQAMNIMISTHGENHKHTVLLHTFPTVQCLAGITGDTKNSPTIVTAQAVAMKQDATKCVTFNYVNASLAEVADVTQSCFGYWQRFRIWHLFELYNETATDNPFGMSVQLVWSTACNR
jgi:hypothetical protein